MLLKKKLKRRKRKQLLNTEQLLKESQVNYYKRALKKEADTRQYRHDMVNHLIYAQELLTNQKEKDAQAYLSSILGGFKKIQSAYYVTGNEMVDTIMNYFLGILPKSAKIIIVKKCPVEIDMEDTEICTIFSNIFQNAIEEITENSINDAEIIVDVLKGRQYVEYSIKNTMVTKIDAKRVDKNGLLKSHKIDKQNHGIGLTNVKRSIENNHGSFEWRQEDGYFCVKIILPIKLK